MSTTSITHNSASVSLWQKSMNWIRAFEEAMEFDPTQSALEKLNHQVAELKGTVQELEAQLDDRNVERS